MKINKIVCDMCQSEIDVEAGGGLGMLEYVYVKHFFEIQRSPNAQPQDRLEKESYDLCKDCAANVIRYVKAKSKSSPEETNINNNNKE